MKNGFLLIAAVVSTTVCAQSGPTLEVGLGHGWVSGTRNYGTLGYTDSRTDAASVPSIGLWFKRTNSFSLGVSYAYLGKMKTNGTTAHTIFPDPSPCYDCVYPAVMQDYRIEERIHQFSLIPAWTMKPTENLAVTAGLSLDLFYSKPKLKVEFGDDINLSSEKDLRLGAHLAAYRQITAQSSIGIVYRYSAPPGLSVNTLGLSLRHDF